MVKKTTATPAATTPAPAPVKEQKEKKVKAPKKEAKEQKETVVAPVESAPVEVEAGSLGAKLAEFSAKVQAAVAATSALKNEYKAFEKFVARELKNAAKVSKKKRSSGNRQPSGFVKPTLISDELASFLGKDKGTELARTAVSKEINAYIRANKLQDTANGRKIHPDAKLKKLLNLKAGEELTYFNLQRYMKHHFIKATATA